MPPCGFDGLPFGVDASNGKIKIKDFKGGL